MVKRRGGWKVPAAIAGTENDNFATRALSEIQDNIDIIVRQELTKVLYNMACEPYTKFNKVSNIGDTSIELRDREQSEVVLGLVSSWYWWLEQCFDSQLRGRMEELLMLLD